MPTTRLTKLDCVNEVLTGVGERGVNTLEGLTSQNARIAETLFDQTMRQVLAEGWHFNYDPDFTLSVDATSGEISVPASIARFKAHDMYWIQTRGDKLYDRQLQTFKFKQAVAGEVIFYREFDEMPEDAKQYIIAVSARKMHEQFVQAPSPQGIFLNERNMRALLTDREYEVADYNTLDDPRIPFYRGSEYVPGTERKNPHY